MPAAANVGSKPWRIIIKKLNAVFFYLLSYTITNNLFCTRIEFRCKGTAIF